MNKVVLIGRLTKDADLRFAAGSGTGVSRFTLAVNRKFKKDETDFINCVAFGKTAETISQYMQKGSQIAIEGHIQTGSYEKDGQKHYTTDVIVDSFDFVGSAKRESIEDVLKGAGVETEDKDLTPMDDSDMPF